jgi:formamidopyrimidine-DNA glycosylase
MPEGPTCHRVAHKLHGRFERATLQSVDIAGGRYKTHGPPIGWPMLADALSTGPVPIVGVGCKGKLIWWLLGDFVLLSTLGLSGSWSHGKQKHSHVRFSTDRGTVWFTDQLHYGTLKVVARDELRKKLRSLGKDVLRSPPFSHTWFERLLNRYPTWTVPKLLMDQSKVSGVGNYLKAEIIYAACLDPHLPVGQMDAAARRRLYVATIVVPRADLLRHRIYVDVQELSWRFCFRVYGKKRDPEGREVQRDLTTDKRRTYWVPAMLA